jgi:glycosyltransferase involved in cell wall biosynthesis
LIAPKVSILTPAFNFEKYISECIESVLRQSYRSWELIIIDDGSTDETVKKANAFSDPRITVLSEKHRGISKLKETYNTGLKEAKGEYIAILEGDDFIPSEKLKIQTKVFNNFPNVILSWGKTSLWDGSKYVIPLAPDFSMLPMEAFLRLMLEDCIIPNVSVMVKRESLEEIGGFQQNYYNAYVDYPTWLKLLDKGNFHFTNEILGYWRIRKNSVSHTYNSRPDLDTMKAFKDLSLGLKKKTGYTEETLKLHWIIKISKIRFYNWINPYLRAKDLYEKYLYPIKRGVC